MITTEEFNAFHAIDRALYTLLIFALGRDPAQSMLVMGLLLWLERNDQPHDLCLVKRMLSMKTCLVNSVAEESVVCLKCVENDDGFDPDGNDDLPLLRSLCMGRDLSLRYFYENRVSVLCGVTKIVSEVCARAFEDIIVRHLLLGLHRNPNIFVGSSSTSSSCGVPLVVVAAGGGGASTGVLDVPYYPAGIAVGTSGGLTGDVAQTAPFMAATTTRHHHGVAGEENIEELLGSTLSLQCGGEERQVPPDDRTIFLTFSRGYPISENEVRDFFTRKYGEILEAINMQEVGEEEQVLYARVVTRSASSIGVVLGGQRKSRFSINGKHVWARKYIKKHYPNKSPGLITTTGPTTTSTATNSGPTTLASLIL